MLDRVGKSAEINTTILYCGSFRPFIRTQLLEQMHRYNIHIELVSHCIQPMRGSRLWLLRLERGIIAFRVSLTYDTMKRKGDELGMRATFDC